MPIYKDGKHKNEYGVQRYKVRINYTDSTGKARQLTRIAYGKDEAKLLELKLLAEKKEPQAALTVEALSKMYILDKQYNMRESTVNKNEITLKHHILPFLGYVKMNKLNTRKLNEWKYYIQEKALSHRTNKNIYSELRALLNWAVKQEYLQSNPLNAVDNFRDAYAPGEKEKLKYYTASEFKKYINAAYADAALREDYRYYMFFMIAFYTGMRKGEINALRWDDIEEDKINVRRSIAQKLKGPDRETPPKNKSSYRTLLAPKKLIQLLNEHKIRDLGTYVCGGSCPLRDTSIDNYNRKYAKMCNLEHISVHSFRHSHASLLANAGINIQEIARRLGHADVKMTWNTYSHLYPQAEEQAVQVLDNI